MENNPQLRTAAAFTHLDDAVSDRLLRDRVVVLGQAVDDDVANRLCAQLLLLAVGCFFAAGTTGPTGAMVARLTHESIRATAFGTLTLFNNVLGLAAGPIVTGILADRLGLATAMRYVPLAAVVAVVLLLIGRRAYPASIQRLESGAASGGTA